MRSISAYKEERVEAAKVYAEPKIPVSAETKLFIDQVADALQFATIMCYAQGMSMLHTASEVHDMQIPCLRL